LIIFSHLQIPLPHFHQPYQCGDIWCLNSRFSPILCANFITHQKYTTNHFHRNLKCYKWMNLIKNFYFFWKPYLHMIETYRALFFFGQHVLIWKNLNTHYCFGKTYPHKKFISWIMTWSCIYHISRKVVLLIMNIGERCKIPTETNSRYHIWWMN
jgi:hypothetical protein